MKRSQLAIVGWIWVNIVNAKNTLPLTSVDVMVRLLLLSNTLTFDEPRLIFSFFLQSVNETPSLEQSSLMAVAFS